MKPITRLSLYVLAVALACPAAACARPHANPPLDGVYGIQSGCPDHPAPDVDVIKIVGDVISDLEDQCTMTKKSAQPDGIVKFKIQCQSDHKPRTGPGFVYSFADGRIMLDYGYGPSIWHRCTKSSTP